MDKKNKELLKTFIIIVIPIISLWLLLTISNIRSESKYTIENKINENLIQDKNTTILVEKYLSEIVENIKVVRDAEEFTEFVNGQSGSDNSELTQLFVRVMTNKLSYDQIRFIDLSGQEIIRVDNEDNIVVIPKTELQYKGDRYYFKDSIALEYDNVYISTLDLNVENGEIEEPIKPMIRFATPIFGEDEALKGILIINYTSDYFVSLMRDDNMQEEHIDSSFYVINSYGQYIIHSEEELSFSFMYEETKNLSLKQTNSDLWKILVDADFQGSFQSDNRVYTFYDLLNESRGLLGNSENRWVMIRDLDFSYYASPNYIFTELFLSYNGLILLIVILITFILAYIFERLKSREGELDITNQIAESTNDAVIITDSDTNIVYVNKAYEVITGFSKEEVVGLKPSNFKSGKHTKEFYQDMWHSIDNSGTWEGMLWDRKKDQLLYPKKLRIYAINGKNSKKVHHYVGIFSDMSANKRKSDIYDNLTFSEGELIIPNEEMMIGLLNQNTGNKQLNFMVVYIAIENYNQLATTINKDDSIIAEIFTELVKPLIKNEDLIAQTGRNLYAIIFSIHKEGDDGSKTINRLHKQIEEVIEIDGKEIFFKTRIGISFWPKDTYDIKKLLLNSMIALEWTRRSQEKDIAYYADHMLEQLNEENEIEAYLRKAIERDELSIVYQPQVNISTDRVIGMEALVRWNNKVLGHVSPVVFIPIAERNRLMVEIGDWIIEKVCSDIYHMNTHYDLESQDVRCAINISAIQMAEYNFTEKLFQMIDKHKLKSHQLEMEITESLLLSNETKSVKILNEVREKGLHIAIDDFGTGYSSLSYLKTLPIDKIKIDRSFIKDYPEDDDGKLVKILVEMSKTLNMKVLMEGAETIEQVNYLNEIECNYIQGYYYSKPLKLEEFIEYLKDNRGNK